MFVKRNNLACLLLLCLVSVFAGAAYGQEAPPKPPKEKEKVKVPFPEPGPKPPGFLNGDGYTSEKSILVDPGVAVKLCVSEGDLRINGWSRNEVRIFVRNGRKFHMKELEKSTESGKANWLWIANAVEGSPGPGSGCLAGERIEIDAPVGASFDLAGRAATTSVDSVKKVKVKILEGVISLRNIPGGIAAYTGQGDVMVENSGGGISLESTTGNIIAAEVSQGQIGDLFRAKTTSGAISLQKVEHRQIEASSISGSLLFDGKFLTGGLYNFRTSNGSIKLSIPPSSSCMIDASYGFGRFNYDVPLTILTENVTPRAKTIKAKMGKGDATVSLQTTSGSIGITKR